MTEVTGLLMQDEAAARLGVKPCTLEKWRALRKGPRFLKVGGLVRYRQVHLDEWLEQQTRGGSARRRKAA
jgi:excisionase family DNA binding protein